MERPSPSPTLRGPSTALSAMPMPAPMGVKTPLTWSITPNWPVPPLSVVSSIAHRKVLSRLSSMAST